MQKSPLSPFLSLVILITFFYMNSSTASARPEVSFDISFSQPHTHYADVTMKINQLDRDETLVKMATWTPGSYLIREYARNITSISAVTNTGQVLSIKKINKNTWAIPTKGITSIELNYQIYGFELSVRTNYITAEKAYINGAPTFLYLSDGLDLPVQITLKDINNWQKVATSLPISKKPTGQHIYAKNYDELFDSPIAIGNFTTKSFKVDDKPHTLALIGEGNYNADKMAEDINLIAKAATNVFGDNPVEKYVILNLSTDGKYGGLEHAESTSLMFPRWNYHPEAKYNRWLGLMSHEYFHLWNVKRIRPETLGPFDYENENYTNMLWVVEGITSYYDDYLLRRAGLISEDKYLKVVASNITNLENKPGNKVQPVTHASHDAWIKYYRADENFDNCCVSYYLKGAVLATMLDLDIRAATNGKKNLDDVMAKLYDNYKVEDRGYTDAEFREIVETIAGKDMSFFFDKLVDGTEEIPYNQYLNALGLKLIDENANTNQLSLGLSTKTDKNGKLIINKLRAGTPAYNGGLNVNDELIAINGYRVSTNTEIATILNTLTDGQTVPVMLSRDSRIHTYELRVTKDNTKKYTIKKIKNPTNLQTEQYKAWIKSTISADRNN